jgi:ABC-type lipoprotein release transport system permease subunit
LGAVGLVLGAEFRRRWRAWLTLAVLIAISGGLVLAAAAGARRTAAAFPRFVAAHGYDALVFNLQPLPGVAALPEVASATTAAGPINGQMTCACTHDINNTSNLQILAFSPTALGRVVNLIAGRMPIQSSPDEVLASYNLEHDYGVRLGTVIHTPFFAPSQLQAALGGADVAPAGPTVSLRVVGIEAAEPEFPSGTVTNYDLFTTQAFDRAVGQGAASGTEYLVRLRHGAADLPRFGADINAMHPLFFQNEDANATAVAASIHPQAVGWWVLAALAALAAFAVVGQALSRQSVVESEEYPTLTALGLRRRELVVIGTARNLFVALVGAVGAVVVAFVLSPLIPVGEARLAESSTGFAFDPMVLLLGALATLVVVLALGVWPAVRASQVRIGDDRALDAHPSSIVARLASAGAPPSAVIGVRRALERGRGAASVPVGTALFGAALAVMALSATTVFGASLSHLTATPALYGDAYQVLFSNLAQGDPATELTALEHDGAITGIMIGTREQVSVNGVSVYGIAATAVRGPLLLSRVGGRLPAGDGDVALGTTTLRKVGAHVGSVVRVTAQLPTGGARTAAFRVVGTASFPGQFGLGGLGTGAAFTLAGYQNAVCPDGPTRNDCRSAYHANQKFAVMATATSGAKGRADITRYVNTYQGSAARPIVPTSLVNFGEAVNFPLILGLMLALFGVATLTHVLVVSVARRRHEVGLLKALGFVNGQVRAAVRWQATAVAFVGIIGGVPLGVAVGQAAWRAFASNLGAVPVAIVPVGLIAALALGIVVVANLLALAPALAAARSKTAGQLLRPQ